MGKDRSTAIANCIRERSNWSKLHDVHKFDNPKFNKEKVYEDINVASPKLYALIQNIIALDEEDRKEFGHTFKHFIYSDLKSSFGAKLVASGLAAFGFHHAYELQSTPRGKSFVLKPPVENSFATLTTVTFFQKPVGINFRKEILKRFNSRPDNIHGEKLRIIILDSGLREGVDLFDVKYVHLFEPILTKNDEKQAIGRATRFCGQKGLEFNNGWPLQVYRYDTESLFELFMKYSNIDLKKLTLAKVLEDVVVSAAVDRSLTSAFRIQQAGGGAGYMDSKNAQQLRIIQARKEAAERARKPFMEKRRLEEERHRKRMEEERERLRIEYERRQALQEEYERQRKIKLIQEAVERERLQRKREAELAEQERLRQIKLAEEAAERERLRQIKEAEEAERERLRQIRLAEEAAERERLRQIKEAEEAAERERLRQIKEAEEAAEQERLRKIQEAHEAAERERLRELQEAEEALENERRLLEKEKQEAAERERLRLLKEAEEAAERERLRQIKEAEEAAERERLRMIQEAHEAAERQRIAELERIRRETILLQLERERIRRKEEQDKIKREEEERKRLEEKELEKDKLRSPPPKDGSLNQLEKYIEKTFMDLSWPPIHMENGCDSTQPNSLDFSPTQNFIRHYLTPVSPYHGLLAFHSVGTGKTCLAIATATTHFEPKGWTILYVTKTTLKGDVWKNMFDQVCSVVFKRKIEKGFQLPDTRSAQMRLLSKSWNQIQPLSYKQFSNMLKGKNSLSTKLKNINGNIDPLQKTLVIIDEAHKLFVSDMPPSERVDIKAVRHALQHSYKVSKENSVKLLLMTGTPYTDNPMDMVQLLNLLLDSEKQLPEEFNGFAKEFLNEQGEFTKQGQTQFMDRIAGLVSYLNRENDRRTFSYPIVHDWMIPMSKSDYKEMAASFQENQSKVQDLEETLKSLENPKEIELVQTQLQECEKTVEKVKQCKKEIMKKYDKDIKKATKEMDMKKIEELMKLQSKELEKCSKIGPDDCQFLKDELKSIKQKIKQDKERIQNDLKTVHKYDKNLKKEMEKLKKDDYSQDNAIQECLELKKKD